MGWIWVLRGILVTGQRTDLREAKPVAGGPVWEATGQTGKGAAPRCAEAGPGWPTEKHSGGKTGEELVTDLRQK